MPTLNDIQNNLAGGRSQLDRDVNRIANGSNGPVQNQGFTLPPVLTADGNGLPSSKILPRTSASSRRHIIHWYVPEIGVVKMYINPSRIQYNYEKVITNERSKNGYILQYWGENLPTLDLSGSTGSSGVEGLNVLYEIYRAEQYTFDPIALTLASNIGLSGIGEAIGGALSTGVLGNIASSAVNGLVNTNPITQSLMPRNIPTLATLAFGVEMYYSGWVFRGYFNSFGVTESADRIGMFDYSIKFTVTQRRGYRVNDMPWHRSANFGPSNHDAIPLSYENETRSVVLGAPSQAAAQSTANGFIPLNDNGR